MQIVEKKRFLVVANTVADLAQTVAMILLVAKIVADLVQTAAESFLANTGADSALTVENFHHAVKTETDSIPTVEKFRVKTVSDSEETAEMFRAKTAAGWAQFAETFHVIVAAVVGLGAAAVDFAATVLELNHQQRAPDLAVGS